MAKLYDFEIFQNGSKINTIVSDEEFVKGYCERNGYTYSIRNETKRDYTPIEVPLDKQIKTLEERDEFLEDVLAATIQYMYLEAEARAKTDKQLEIASDALAELAQKIYP